MYPNKSPKKSSPVKGQKCPKCKGTDDILSTNRNPQKYFCGNCGYNYSTHVHYVE